MLECRALAQESFQRFEVLKTSEFSQGQTHYHLYQDYVVTRSSNWPHKVLIKDVASGGGESIVGTTLGVFGVLYGGMHLLGWSGPLHTEAELIVWRLSIFVLLAEALSALTVCAYFHVIHKAISKVPGFGWLQIIGELLFVVGFAIICAAVPLYCLLRLYLVVESFISLPYAVDGVYRQPPWSKYFPHLA
ncbi:hypothetical protein B0T16DRAFT_415520 [Cercophora newfieldiana]|uniref:Uncharacterized protein n=1 Tax=Cercophora newfieldiana TaxID=92897 RepID=A0AA39XZM7_9PEZI|nr:hypothetical protein B0T16DRAFT_415520 [Cercophora newfieldiana]